MNALEIYAGSNGDATKAMYAELETRGPVGVIALNLFRAQKCSARAKVYKGRRFKDDAYGRKNWSMGLLCRALKEHSDSLGFAWGWKRDEAKDFHNWVLYIDIPTGQVSFHAELPLSGIAEYQKYSGEWDKTHDSASRIIRFVQDVLDRP